MSVIHTQGACFLPGHTQWLEPNQPGPRPTPAAARRSTPVPPPRLFWPEEEGGPGRDVGRPGRLRAMSSMDSRSASTRLTWLRSRPMASSAVRAACCSAVVRWMSCPHPLTWPTVTCIGSFNTRQRQEQTMEGRAHRRHCSVLVARDAVRATIVDGSMAGGSLPPGRIGCWSAPTMHVADEPSPDLCRPSDQRLLHLLRRCAAPAFTK